LEILGGGAFGEVAVVFDDWERNYCANDGIMKKINCIKYHGRALIVNEMLFKIEEQFSLFNIPLDKVK
jgi:hypothetical protein